MKEPNYISTSRSSFKYNDVLTVLCRNYHDIVGENRIRCKKNKLWSRIPTCTRKISKNYQNDFEQIKLILNY